jgi:hypothetical protein
MRHTIIILAVVVITVSANGQPPTNSAPSGSQERSTSRDYIKIEITANPTNDFTAAIATNDVRFVGYMGYALVVPGVKDYYSRYDRSNGVKVIAGTGDVISPTTFPADVAERYAATYNDLLLRHLKAGEKK